MKKLLLASVAVAALLMYPLLEGAKGKIALAMTFPFPAFSPVSGDNNIAFDAHSQAQTGSGGVTWTHTPVGTPKGVIFFAKNINATDYVTGVTYGGVAMAEVQFPRSLKQRLRLLQSIATFSALAFQLALKMLSLQDRQLLRSRFIAVSRP